MYIFPYFISSIRVCVPSICYVTNLLQINLGSARAAPDLVMEVTERHLINLVLANEPNNASASRRGWLFKADGDSAIWCRNCNLVMHGHRKMKGCIRLELGDFVVYSCYISPSVSSATFNEIVDDIMTDLTACWKEAVIAGDLNTKSFLWSSTSAGIGPEDS